MPLLWLLYALTAAVTVLLGYVLRFRHSPYPNTDTGYPFARAARSEAAWNRANRLCGRVSIVAGLLLFAGAPLLLRRLHLPFPRFLAAYFLSIVLWLLAIWLIPAAMIQKL